MGFLLSNYWNNYIDYFEQLQFIDKWTPGDFYWLPVMTGSVWKPSHDLRRPGRLV